MLSLFLYALIEDHIYPVGPISLIPIFILIRGFDRITGKSIKLACVTKEYNLIPII